MIGVSTSNVLLFCSFGPFALFVSADSLVYQFKFIDINFE